MPQYTGASDVADDIWDVLHPENNKAINSCMDTRTRNCDRFNTGNAEADYATALKKYREETGKVVYNAYDSSGDFIIWMLSGKSLANGTVDGTLHNNEGRESAQCPHVLDWEREGRAKQESANAKALEAYVKNVQKES